MIHIFPLATLPDFKRDFEKSLLSNFQVFYTILPVYV